jgi:CheY-like chemotaxis protein
MVRMEPINLLLVEDDPADQKLIKLSLKNQKIANDIHCVSCGEEALDYLNHRNGFNGNAPKPDLILLDLNMPGMGGKEFLKLIKANEEQKTIPVIILTTSDSERDIIESYQLQASGYVHKPVTLDEFKGVMEKIEDYWFVMCRLPPKDC